MGKRLLIDLDICRDCATCTATCSYPYHESNDGIAHLREVAAQELTCRRCDLRSCVEACPSDALEEIDGILHRYNMRCTACLSCSVACPFGALLPAALEFKDSMCDFCAGRPDEIPECARTCECDAVRFEEVSAEKENIYLIGDHLAVRSVIWEKEEVESQ